MYCCHPPSPANHTPELDGDYIGFLTPFPRLQSPDGEDGRAMRIGVLRRPSLPPCSDRAQSASVDSFLLWAAEPRLHPAWLSAEPTCLSLIKQVQQVLPDGSPSTCAQPAFLPLGILFPYFSCILNCSSRSHFPPCISSIPNQKASNKEDSSLF